MINLDSSGPFAFVAASLNGIFPARLYCQTDEKALSTAKRKEFSEQMNVIGGKLGVIKPLEIIEIEGLDGVNQALGNNFFPGRAGIAIDPYTVKFLDKETNEFLIAHEISHIKNNDLITMFLVPAVVMPTAIVALSVLFPSLASTLIGGDSVVSYFALATSAVSFCYFSKWREECADKSALSVCSKEAKSASVDFFKLNQEMNIDIRNNEDASLFSNIFNKIRFAPNGDSRFDFLHPPLSARIKYLSEAIASEN